MMPTYTFLDKETNEQFDKVLRMRDLDEYKVNNPQLQQVISNNIPIMRGKDMKPDANFRDLLKTIKKGTPRSNVNTFE